MSTRALVDDETGVETTTLGGLVRPVAAMVGHLRGQGRLFTAVAVTVWLALVVSVSTSMLSVAAASAVVADASSAAGVSPRTVLLVAGLCTAVLVLGLLAWFEQWFAHVLAYRVIDSIRIKVHRAISRLAPLGLARRRSGETVSAAMTDAESLEWFYAHTAAQVLAGLVGCLTLSAASVTWLGTPALILPAAQVLVIAVPAALLPVAVRQGSRLRTALTHLSGEALEARSSARETVLLGRLEEVGLTVASATREVQAARRALAVRTGLEQGLIEATSVGVVLTSVVLSGRAAADGALPGGLVPVVVALAGSGLAPAIAVTGALGRLGEVSAAARRVDALITAPSLRPVAPGTDGTSGCDESRPPAPGTVTVKDLLVRYPQAPAAVLDGLDLEVDAGQTLGVVGPSGAGKTTLVLALARLIAPESGTIWIDGVDADDEDPARTRTRLSLVTQQPHVFRTSVRDNLLAPGASDAQLWEALEASRLAEHVRSLPEGLDTVLAERGAAWSGGERQRLGLARGLLHDPSILVLDEPTASLDAHTETEFLSALMAARANRTTIIVTHRRSVMSACDQVVLLDRGRVVARGTHAELLRDCERYRSVVDDGPQDTDIPDRVPEITERR